MRYLITTHGKEPFFTDNFKVKNHWQDGIGLAVYDWEEEVYTKDGINWHEIERDW